MGKGKREASRLENAGISGKKGLSIQPSSVGDPFADDRTKEKNPKTAGSPNFKASLLEFWKSGKGKVLLAVVVCLAILGTAVGAAVSIWVKPPDLPSTADELPKQPQQTDKISTTPSGVTKPKDPSDDELYPDDGYGGDMPEVSGDRKEGMYTFLLVGTDMDDGNTDTIMVVSYDTKKQDISIMSIPRDTMINESWDIKKINSIYSRYKDGIDALKKRIKTLVGFTPDFYVKVDLSMFVKLVDLIGGVEFDVPQDMDYDDSYQNLHIHLKKGVQVLDGEKAMELVRFRRYSEGDIKRVEVQQSFIKALIKECLSIQHWGKIKAYIDLAMENVQTDLEFGSVVWFAANVLGLNSGVSALNMDDVYTCTLPGDYWGSAWSRSTNQQQSYVTIYPSQVVTLVNQRFNPYEQKVTASMLDAMSILSNGNIASSTGSLRDTTHNAVMAVQRGEAYYDSKGKIVYGKPTASSTESQEKDKKDPDKDEKPSKSDNKTVTDPSVTPNTRPDGVDLPLASDDTVKAPSGSGTTSPSNSGGGDSDSPSVPSDESQQPDKPSESGGTAGEPEPDLPPEPDIPASGSPEPEPQPEPEPEPIPEPVVDTEPPEWLLN